MLIRLEYNDRVIQQIDVKEITAEIIIGRSSACTWPVPKEDKLASSRHVSLTRHGGSVLLKDLESTNGTFFNGKRITSRKLAAGDKVSVGNCILYAMPDSGIAKKRYSELLVLSGKERNKKKRLVPPKFTIGSDPGSSLVFLDMLISRNHAEIAVHEDGSCWLRDLNSKNGTSVNGVPLRSEKERLLKDGDKISFSQMETEFHDGSVMRSSSHVWLRLAIIVLTVVLAMGAYNLYRRLQPSAALYVAETRKLAAKEHFEEARRMLLKAETAHHAEAQQVEILQLQRLLEVWGRTAAMWHETRELLKQGQWTRVSRNLGQLQSEKSEAWEWNKKSATERERSFYAKSMLDARSRFLAMLARETVAVEQLAALTREADELLRREKAEDMPDYLQPLHQELVTSHLQLQELLAEAQAVESAMNLLREENPPFDRIVAALAQAVASEKRVIRTQASKLDPIVKALAASSRALEQVIADVHALEGQRVLDSDLRLPSADACALDPRASTARQTLERKHVGVRVQGAQAMVFFKAVEDIVGRQGATLPHLQDFKDIEVMRRLFACDSLEKTLPRRSRKEPSGDYDRMLGVEEFYGYIEALPERLDPVLVSDIAFKPLLTQAQELWKKIDDFIAFVEKPECAWMLEGALKLQRERCKSFLVLRNGVVQILVTKASVSSGREALIAAGIACRMLSGETSATIEGKPIREWVQGRFKEYRKEMLKLNDEFSSASLEQQVAIRDKVMAVGLPGDPIVRRMWAMRDASLGK